MFFVLLLPTLDFGCEILEMYHFYDEAQIFVHVSIKSIQSFGFVEIISQL